MKTNHSTYKHGWTGTSEYMTWFCMKRRCKNKSRDDWKWYGGRGISYCSEWEYFENFIKDMGPKPNTKYTLDRIDNSKGYYKENCQWASQSKQANNRRNNNYQIINGKKYSLIQACKLLKINYGYIRRRMNFYKDTFKQAVSNDRKFRAGHFGVDRMAKKGNRRLRHRNDYGLKSI